MAFAPTANRALGAALVVFAWGLLVFTAGHGPFTGLASALLAVLLGVVGFELFYWALRRLGRARSQLAPRHAVLGGGLLALTCCCGGVFWLFYQDQIVFSVLAAGAYGLGRPLVLSWMRRGAGVRMAGLVRPLSYQLDPEGVSLDLGVQWPDDPARRSPVRIDFAELDQVRLYRPGDQLDLSSPLIPSLNVPGVDTGIASAVYAWRQVQEQVYYRLGESQRPRYWAQLGAYGGPPVFFPAVFLKGPQLMYLVGFAGGGGADIVEAFQAYRAQHPGPAVAAPVPSGGGFAFAIIPAGEQASTGNVVAVTVACLVLVLTGLVLAVIGVTTFTFS